MTSPQQQGGYGCPPEQHRFQKGRSGNPKGRPPRKREAQQAALRTMDEIWMEQARRKVSYIENGQKYEVEATELIVRSIVVAAAKGDHKAQKTFLREGKEAQKRIEEAAQAYLARMVEYNSRAQRQLRQCQLEARPAPELVPHPDDIVIDIIAGTVTLNGPTTPAEKVEWDMQFASRAAAQEELRQLRATRPRAANKAAHQRCIQDEQDRIDDVNRTYPDEQIRRAPGFDLNAWRLEQRKIWKGPRARAKARDTLTGQAPASAPDGGPLLRPRSSRRKAGT